MVEFYQKTIILAGYMPQNLWSVDFIKLSHLYGSHSIIRLFVQQNETKILKNRESLQDYRFWVCIFRLSHL